MNILIVSQSFKLGGLETNILSNVKILKEQGMNIYFATSREADLSIIANYLEDILFLENWSPLNGTNMAENVEVLKGFMISREIDFVHLHPYEGVFIGAVAAMSLKKPYVVTVHSPANLHPSYGFMYKFLMVEAVLNRAAAVYCVSQEVKEFLLNLNKDLPVQVLQNAVDTDTFRDEFSNNTGPWVAVSRLDEDKIEGLKKAVNLFAIYGQSNKVLKIIGNGNEKDQFQSWVKNQFPELNITFTGSSNNINEEIRNASLVLGMGRVVLESLACNKITLLVGYDGLKGIVKRANFDTFAYANFSGRNMTNKMNEQILEEFESVSIHSEEYKLRNTIVENFSLQRLSRLYITNENLVDNKEQNRQWASQAIQISKQIGTDIIFDAKYVQLWLNYSDLNVNLKTQMLLNSYYEINSARFEKDSLLQRLSMTQQNLHDSNIYYSEQKEEMLKAIREIKEEKKSLEERFFKNEELNKEVERLKLIEEQFSENHALFIGEKESFVSEKNTIIQEKEMYKQKIDAVTSKIYELSGTKFFKSLSLLKKFKLQFIEGDLKNKRQFVKWFYGKVTKKGEYEKNVFNPLFELFNILEQNFDPNMYSEVSSLTIVEEMKKDDFLSIYERRQRYFKTFLLKEHTVDTQEIAKILGSKEPYKGIIVYPAAVHWEPVQRPQHLLRVFASLGYLCIFIENSSDSFVIKELEPNLFFINKEEALLPWIYNKHVTVLCTWLMQMSFADLLPHKTLWYDVLDRPDFLSLSDSHSMQRHNKILKEADIVTYSAHALKENLQNTIATYLPNGVDVKDFSKSESKMPEELSDLRYKSNVILGYYGAIEEWFDLELIQNLASRNPQWEIVLIGKSSLEDLSNQISKHPNIHYLGPKSYHELFHYSKQFDVGLIPFKVSDLTNAVSPVKFFEYQAAGLPVVSTSIAEMRQYENEYVFLADEVEGFEEAIIAVLKNTAGGTAEAQIKEYAKQNMWSDRVSQVESLLMQKPQTWVAHANAFSKNKIGVMTASFLGFKGDNYYSGGAERYLIDLSGLCEKMGFELVIYQYGDFPWMRRFKNIDVISLSRNGLNTEIFSTEKIQAFNRSYYDQANNAMILNIYSAFFEAWPFAANPSIGISHGVAWDGPSSSYNSGIQFWETNRRFIEGAKACDKLVSVDTNTANWFQTIDFNVGHQMEVVTNYVDLDHFYPRNNYLEPIEDRLVILYPRRLYSARGLYIVLDILDDLLEKYPQVEFHFVGKGFEEDTVHVEQKRKRWKDRVKWFWKDPEEMNEVYREADITLIPTLHSEGTSLSCLEAMASGNAVVATRIGGLTDLVINNYNGMLIDPNSVALKHALYSMLDNPQKLDKFKKNALNVARSFSKKNWELSWSTIINTSLNKSVKESSKDQKQKVIEIYVNDLKDLNENLGRLIVSYLQQGHLLYIKGEKFSQSTIKSRSFDRLQFLSWENEAFLNADFTISLQNCSEKVAKLFGEVDMVFGDEL